MTRFALALLAAVLLLVPGCFGGPSEGWQQKNLNERRLDLDLENCAWDAEHQRQEDGTYVEVERSDEEIEAFIKGCMAEKGYRWGLPGEEDE